MFPLVSFPSNGWLTNSVGEIHAMIKGGKKLLNPLVAAQNFEYKMSNILGQKVCRTYPYLRIGY